MSDIVLPRTGRFHGLSLWLRDGLGLFDLWHSHSGFRHDTAPCEKIVSAFAHLVQAAGVLPCDADGNLFRFRVLGLRQGDDQQSVCVVGLHLLVLHVDRERKMFQIC